MSTKRPQTRALARKLKSVLQSQPGLSVKDLAGRLHTNRQFMAGFLSAMEEYGEVTHRQVGPARIYFPVSLGS